MKKYAIIGYPLTHSISPFIHKLFFDLKGVDADYQLLEIAPANFDELKTVLPHLDGYNITIPYKNAVLQFTRTLDDFARIAGSVNVVKNANICSGYNTDVYGFLEAINKMRIDISRQMDCLILGCGGSGRMVLTALASLQKKITLAVLNPLEPGLQKIKDDLLSIYPNCEINFADIKTLDIYSDLCINTTPVGMFPNIDATPLSDKQIKKCTNIFDLVYNPQKTLLVKKAQYFGVNAQNGLWMLVLQAAKAHEIWYNAKFSDEEIDLVYNKAYNIIS